MAINNTTKQVNPVLTSVQSATTISCITFHYGHTKQLICKSRGKRVKEERRFTVDVLFNNLYVLLSFSIQIY